MHDRAFVFKTERSRDSNHWTDVSVEFLDEGGEFAESWHENNMVLPQFQVLRTDLSVDLSERKAWQDFMAGSDDWIVICCADVTDHLNTSTLLWCVVLVNVVAEFCSGQT